MLSQKVSLTILKTVQQDDTQVMDNQNYYDKKFTNCLASDKSKGESAQIVIDAYLDNKPQGSKKKKVSPAERHQLFWHSEFWQLIPLEVYSSESFALALTTCVEDNGVTILTISDLCLKIQASRNLILR